MAPPQSTMSCFGPGECVCDFMQDRISYLFLRIQNRQFGGERDLFISPLAGAESSNRSIELELPSAQLVLLDKFTSQ
jgi:hypothetical protein